MNDYSIKDIKGKLLYNNDGYDENIDCFYDDENIDNFLGFLYDCIIQNNYKYK